jgi:membrane protein DedA with SNARE-associated domain
MPAYLFEMLVELSGPLGLPAVGAALLLENAGLPVPGETILLLASPGLLGT